jgi:hypothetical protein
MLRPLYYGYFLLACTAGAAALGDRILWPAPPERSNVELLSDQTLDARRLEAKARIGEDAASGRLSLLQAASALKELDASGAPYPLPAITNYDPGVSIDEGYCRMVICFLPSAASPNQADSPARRLQTELDERLRDGSLRLP